MGALAARGAVHHNKHMYRTTITCPCIQLDNARYELLAMIDGTDTVKTKN